MTELEKAARMAFDLSTPTLREMVTRHAVSIDPRATLEHMPEALTFQIEMARALLREFGALTQALAPTEPVQAGEREAFEAWYAEDANKQTGKPAWFTPEEIAKLRDGDEYGEHRVMLNGKWAGWQARAATERKREPVYLIASAISDGEPYTWRIVSRGVHDKVRREDWRKVLYRHVPLYTSPQVPEDTDPLQGAVNWLCEARMDVSVDLIQQKLHIGYNRAKRLFDAARKGE